MYWNTSYSEPVVDKDKELTLHELASEVHIVGVGSYFNGNILIGPIADSMREKPYSLNVQTIHNKNAEYTTKHATAKGYYNLTGVPGEFMAMLALFFHTRFYHIATVNGLFSSSSIIGRTKKRLVRYSPPADLVSRVFEENDARNYKDFEGFLDKIHSIPEKYHRPIVMAGTNYNFGLQQMGVDNEMAYVRFISAIEIFSSSIKLTQGDDALYGVGIDKLTLGMRTEAASEIQIALQTRKSLLKFIRFLEKYSEGFFDDASTHWGKVKSGQLHDIAKAVYTARSKYLHEAESMFISEMFGDKNVELDSALGLYVGRRKFDAKSKLPTISFFERLTSFCLLKKIDELYHATKN